MINDLRFMNFLEIESFIENCKLKIENYE